MISQTKKGFMPDITIAPGETLQEYSDSLAMTQVDLAKRTGLTPKTINEIIKGKAPITPETALKLESVFATPASFWNNLESNYQETKARLQAEKDIDDEIKIAKLIPYTELARRSFVQPTTKAKDKVVYLRHFFGVASLEYIPDVLEVGPPYCLRNG
jgi:HTH-type transcriptional regulator/antitoxin HigA